MPLTPPTPGGGGGSVLIHKSLSFTLVDLHLDPEGKFVILHVVIANVTMAVV